MANLKMPNIEISFQTRAADAVARSEKGVVCLLLKDGALDGTSLKFSNVTEIPAELGAKNAACIKRCFTGYIYPPKRVLAYVFDGENHSLDDALAWAAAQSFDYLVPHADATVAELTTISSWVKSQRLNNCAIYKAILPDFQADSEAVVNFCAAGIQTADGEFTGADYCSRIAGLIAGTPMRISATYASLPEVSDISRMDADERNAAVAAGKFILWHDGTQVLTGRAVNSLQTTTDTKGDAFKKIKIVEIIDMMQQDIRTTTAGSYIGKYPNTYDNKLLLITAIRGYLMGLESDALIQSGWSCDIDTDAQETYLVSQGTDTGEMSEQEIRQADTGSYVFIKISCKVLDAIEDVTIKVAI